MQKQISIEPWAEWWWFFYQNWVIPILIFCLACNFLPTIRAIVVQNFPSNICHGFELVGSRIWVSSHNHKMTTVSVDRFCKYGPLPASLSVYVNPFHNPITKKVSDPLSIGWCCSTSLRSQSNNFERFTTWCITPVSSIGPLEVAVGRSAEWPEKNRQISIKVA